MQFFIRCLQKVRKDRKTTSLGLPPSFFQLSHQTRPPPPTWDPLHMFRDFRGQTSNFSSLTALLTHKCRSREPVSLPQSLCMFSCGQCYRGAQQNLDAEKITESLQPSPLTRISTNVMQILIPESEMANFHL